MEQQTLLNEVAGQLGLQLKEDNSSAAKQFLADHINQLIEKDFQRLISILYRVDVSENKLRDLLKENPGTDAGILITELMIERQVQKIESRKKFKSNENPSEEEKW